MERIKANIVSLAAALTALGSGITGLGAQTAFAPMLSWMLGFGPEKATGTATRFAVIASGAAVAGACLSGAVPAFFWWRGLLLLVSAVLGAMLAAPVASALRGLTFRRLFQTFGAVAMLFVILQASHFTPWQSPHIAFWNTSAALFLLGASAGALTQVMSLAGGTLLIPGLYFLSGFSGPQSVSLSLLVVCVAALLPAWAYTQQGLVDKRVGDATLIGGLIGGMGGGLLLARLSDRFVLTAFALVAMFLCGREIARMTLGGEPVRPAE